MLKCLQNPHDVSKNSITTKAKPGRKDDRGQFGQPQISKESRAVCWRGLPVAGRRAREKAPLQHQFLTPVAPTIPKQDRPLGSLIVVGPIAHHPLDIG